MAGAGGGVIGARAAQDEAPTALATVGSTAIPFRDRHQAGITTPLHRPRSPRRLRPRPGHRPQDGRRAAAPLVHDGRELTAGEPTGSDTGVALDAGPASLTVTFGFGRTFFDRTGLTEQRPEVLAPLPDFTSDALDPRRSNGDLWVQIGADDGLVAFHALRAVQQAARKPLRPGTAASCGSRGPAAWAGYRRRKSA